MRVFKTDTTMPEPAPAPSLGMGELVKAAGVGSVCLALAALGISLLAWRSPWWELILACALAPVAILGLGMAAVEVRGLQLALADRDAGELEDSTEPERVRLVPVNHRPVVDGCDAADLAFFTRTAIGAADWTQATWRGRRMPSGRACDNRYHAALVAALVKVGVIVDYSRGSSGHLAITDVAQALELLGVSAN